ncbi:tryptophan synthase subunit alpha [Streptomyces mexicanus]|uniref:Tryptophan synthase alpha chain n=1 Tax=Streptomyces mexicanus TaxID=178566 RepID=A0A7X1I6U5_9ACTN|nr:tryptophan synthase subunit alpha [Streptomyces mexicanus]MBC2869869.1 tryptophan synthase subunit alpha [Streptomyces mexicanus]
MSDAFKPWSPPVSRTSSWPATRLERTLAASSAEGRAALGLYLPIGYPTRSASVDALHFMAQSADVLELGVPHTHPVLDGPVIRQAAAEALAGGFRMRDLFAAASELSASSPAALVVMSYWAPIAEYGPRPFAYELAAAGGSGVLIPDLPESEATGWQAAAGAAGLSTIALIPAHASAARLAAIGAATTGMVYAPATPGPTGGQGPLRPYLPRLVRRLREATRLPVAVGIGISTPAQAEYASGFADAVVVGSAVIRRMQDQPNSPAAAAAAAARDFAEGVHSARRTLS